MIGGDHLGQEDPAQDLPGAGAVHQGRLLQLTRDRLEGVAHDVDAERELDHGVHDCQTEQVVGQPQCGEHEEDRGEQGLVGDDQSQEEEDEYDLLARDGEPGQAITGGHGQDQGHGDGHERRDHAVRQIPGQTRCRSPTTSRSCPGSARWGSRWAAPPPPPAVVFKEAATDSTIGVSITRHMTIDTAPNRYLLRPDQNRPASLADPTPSISSSRSVPTAVGSETWVMSRPPGEDHLDHGEPEDDQGQDHREGGPVAELQIGNELRKT